MVSQSTENNSENAQNEQVIEPEESQQSVEWKASELAVIFDWLENKYDKIFGHGKGKNYKRKKDNEWEDFVQAVNEVYRGKNRHTRESIYTKIDNMKTQGKDANNCLLFDEMPQMCKVHCMYCFMDLTSDS